MKYVFKVRDLESRPKDSLLDFEEYCYDGKITFKRGYAIVTRPVEAEFLTTLGYVPVEKFCEKCWSEDCVHLKKKDKQRKE